MTERIDPDAARQAPGMDVMVTVTNSTIMGFDVQAAEVVSIVVPTVAGALVDRIANAAAHWLRRRRRDPCDPADRPPVRAGRQGAAHDHHRRRCRPVIAGAGSFLGEASVGT
jgi:hypothetical protein